MSRSFGYAAAGFGFFVFLAWLSFLFTGGGHGTALFAMITLAPGSAVGDNPFALTGVLFWPLVGYVLARAPDRKAQVLIALLMIAHYAVAGFYLAQEGSDGGAGFWRTWRVLPVHVGLYCSVYAAGNIMIWIFAFRGRSSRKRGHSSFSNSAGAAGAAPRRKR
jgi:hypothetical protein